MSTLVIEPLTELETQLTTVSRKAGVAPNIEKANLFTQIAKYWEDKNRDKKAVEYLELASKEYEKFGHKSYEKLADLYNNQARLWAQLGKYRLSVEFFRRGLDVNLQRFGQQPNIEIAQSHFYVASMLDSLWRQKKAMDHYDKSLKMTIELLGETHEDTLKLKEQIKEAEERLSKHHNQQ